MTSKLQYTLFITHILLFCCFLISLGIGLLDFLNIKDAQGILGYIAFLGTFIFFALGIILGIFLLAKYNINTIIYTKTILCLYFLPSLIILFGGIFEPIEILLLNIVGIMLTIFMYYTIFYYKKERTQTKKIAINIFIFIMGILNFWVLFFIIFMLLSDGSWW